MSSKLNIGSYFRSVRRLQGLSQSDVVSLTEGTPVSVSKAMLSAIEKGRHMPGLRSFVSLCKALHIDPAEIYEMVDVSKAVEVDLTGVSRQELRERAAGHFWKGDYRQALGIYDAMLEHLALDPPEDLTERRHEQARIEILRSAALRRLGAANAARAAALRATTLGEGAPGAQAEAYVLLSAILATSGDLPVARDLVDRAVALAGQSDRATRALAAQEKGAVLFRSGRYQDARDAFETARKLARGTRNENHHVHIEGNIGSCLEKLGKTGRARSQYVKAVQLARRHSIPIQEATWRIQLGRLALTDGEFAAAEQHGRDASRIAKGREDELTYFRAEWLLHLVVRQVRPKSKDVVRLRRLARIYPRLRRLAGSDEIKEYEAAGYAPGTGV